MKEKIFNFNNIENEILKLEKLEQNKENHCLRELKLFKEFSDENFLINKQSNTNLLNNYWISSGYKINNIVYERQNNNIGKNSYKDTDIDIYFINKDKEKIYFFIFEIKDLSLNTLKILDYYNYSNCKNHILEKDINLANYIIPLFNKKYVFIRCNIIKYPNDDIKYDFYKYNWKDTQKWRINEFHTYRIWKHLTKKEIINILLKTENINLNIRNFEKFKIESYNNKFLLNLLDNYKNISFIQKILFSLSNIKTLIPYENKDNESFITKINGLPGSGKTVFAFLLFCTESKCILIVSNKKFFNEYKQSCIKIEKDKSNKFTLINENFISNVEDELSDYKFVIIDESQNIENEVLLKICKFCFDNKKKLYLLSDFNQNIYAWNNLKGLYKYYKNNFLENKDKDLEEKIGKEILKKKFRPIEWKESNRINSKDISKINYLLLGKNNFLDEYKNNKITSLLMINKCQTSSLKKIEKLFKKENILVISHKNFGNEEYLNQYQHIGYEYDELIIFINKNMFYDSKSNCLMYSFDEISEYALMYDCLYNLVYFDALFTWLVVAFTRATKSIRIFVDENNPDKENICKYFNDRIDELEKDNTKN